MTRRDPVLADALQDSLERIAAGESIDACLARHPGVAAELAPLLRMAAQTQAAAQTMAPSSQAVRAGHDRLAGAWPAPRSSWRIRWPVPRVLARTWALAALAALVLALGGWTTVSAAADSLPGEALYPVKQTHERVLLLVVIGEGRRADLHVRFAQTRTTEATELASRGSDPDAVDRATRRMEEHMRQAVALMGGRLSSHDARALQPPPWFERPFSPSAFGRQEGAAPRAVAPPPFGPDSQRRFAMQQRFYQQFLRYDEGRFALPDDLRPHHRQRFEAAFSRSQALLAQAFLIMQELEDAQRAGP